MRPRRIDGNAAELLYFFKPGSLAALHGVPGTHPRIETEATVSRLATSVMVGMGALAALLLIRGARKTQRPEGPEIIVIHSGLRVDTPSIDRGERPGPMVIVPLKQV